ncbi:MULTISPECIES: aminomethyl-transferring glycine dehydrogenase subunit GcvPA [Oceanobacillus]|uniref:Probable glycine dehydrogenase (decarboxylating) subunit 1 n=1 Tax=Oceanobacillus kimchii TaxID=746691 RepID=A0ABQ5TK60_9BACI|nr:MULTISPECIES: aminomethyl-transferring glycine dehydrogenase subunit GcvPA [Oceanobacillus]MBT2598345.1 aminomethyl-transferring glycine dehydrogenase subunit GcvPA [Oceanobacillus sp. ISL-74]MBT2651263.1 aminomethyl-transferring glycine dehydrogenase subunit GcvPA [Oceanobacillus sp. ISL-73]MCT1575922.1 aminomethyl-transferring glycine dehydrogenase subunit GcvPA [Oceanobacillus kimchii]MCT2135559.1 aminomethyl-transferring glycine dehydrogenase subunit GcvPA [Oceanobacillus kimchii]OEH556
MEFRYLPMTNLDKREMLDAIGIQSTEELFSDIPEHVRFKGEMNLKAPISEYELTKELTELASRNIHTKEYTSFLGAGVYDHYIPSVVDHVISRSEFYTAYTPYQPEISQGELQAIFEFQTMISELTGLPVANSSMYDGGTALAEAVNLSAAHTKRKKVLVSKAVHPEYRAVIDSYTKGQSIEVIEIDTVNGITDLTQLDQALDDTIAGVVVQYPNFFGQLEPMKKIEQLLENHQKTMLIVSSNPLALGYLTPPGEFGADIVTGDTQVFGIPAQFGGPHCGYFATTKKLMRKVPGRLVGETVDEEGTRGYVLTLQAREQHIRRDKATSNICSNQALNALASSVAMSSIGKHGLRKLASVNMQKARYAKKKILEAGIEVAFDGAFFNEFVIKVPGSVSKINKHLLDKGIIAGYDLAKDDKSLEGYMLIAVTEVRTKEEIDQFVKELGDVHV